MDATLITCKHCGRGLPKSMFYFDKKGQRKSGGCRDCERERLQRYRESERGKRANHERQRRYLETPEGKATRQRYRQSEKGKANQRRYAQSPKGKELKAAVAHGRNVKLYGSSGLLTAAEWRAIKITWQGRCAYCDCEPEILTMDHVTPLCRGGSHTAENVVPACGPCNFSKGGKLLDEWDYATGGAIDRIQQLRNTPINLDLAKALIAGTAGDADVEALR